MRAVVLGGADNVWSDLEAARRLCTFDLVVAVNAAFRTYPGEIDAAVTFHTDLLPTWIEQRRAAGFPDARTYWSSRGQRAIPGMTINTVPAWGGSSGMIGAEVGIALATHVVLCGIPMDPAAEHFDRPGAWQEALHHRHAWEAHAEELRTKVRSMSGWTAGLLGEPTAEWLGVVHNVA